MTNIQTIALTLGLAASTLSLTGCVETDCSAKAYLDGINVEFSQPLTTSGSYIITTTLGDATNTCELILVDSNDPNDCVDGVCVTTIRSFGSGPCNGHSDATPLDTNGELSGLTLFLFHAPYDDVTVRLERDGVLVGENTSPLYGLTTQIIDECHSQSSYTLDLTISNP